MYKNVSCLYFQTIYLPKLLDTRSGTNLPLSSALQVVFTHTLPAEVEFSKCWRVAVRGYTKAGVTSTVAGDLQDCKDYDLVRPSLVIDALGDPGKVTGMSLFLSMIIKLNFC